MKSPDFHLDALWQHWRVRMSPKKHMNGHSDSDCVCRPPDPTRPGIARLASPAAVASPPCAADLLVCNPRGVFLGLGRLDGAVCRGTQAKHGCLTSVPRSVLISPAYHDRSEPFAIAMPRDRSLQRNLRCRAAYVVEQLPARPKSAASPRRRARHCRAPTMIHRLRLLALARAAATGIRRDVATLPPILWLSDSASGRWAALASSPWSESAPT